MRGFLWCHGDMKRGKAKIAWEKLCLPKYEGGLGIRNLEKFNVALMTTHIWNILSCKESMWVSWIHAYKLKGRSFWDVPAMSNVSWGWRKIMQIRDIVRPYFWHHIGNGMKTSFWFDNWCDHSPLRNHFTVRCITREGFNLGESVAEMSSNGAWLYPATWYNLYPILNQVNTPVFVANTQDKIMWKDSNAVVCEFTVKAVWESIRPRGQEVEWFRMVWFSFCIPKHAFNLWLIMARKLKTQDKLRQWDVGESVDLNLLRCPLCKTTRDSHEHLFFECPYSLKVWILVNVKAGMHNTPSKLEDITSWLISISSKRSLVSVVSRLMFAAATYFIWQERNNRLFSTDLRKEERVCEVIFETVRMKLVSLRFKRSSNVMKTLQYWNIPSDVT